MRIALVIQFLSYLVGLPLQVLIVAGLLRGAYRRFPFVFGYAVAAVLASAVETPLYVLGTFDRQYRHLYVNTYWIDEQILLALVYAVVASLIMGSTGANRSRRMVRLVVIGGVVLFAAITFVIHFDRHIAVGEWMTPWTRELNFCAAILDLGLWALLIGMREKDHRLLLLSGGLGIMFTGEGIGQSVRQLSQSSHSTTVSLIGNVIIMVSNLAFLYVWRSAVRPARVGNGHSTHQ